jgi:hypothetical protein
MSTFEIVKWYSEGKSCQLYSIHIFDKRTDEASLFFEKYGAIDHPKRSYTNQLLLLIIKSIANKYGASDDFFDRHENDIHALPPKPKKYITEISLLGSSFPLRIYCMRITNEILILFNGGEKTAPSTQGSKDLSMKFYEALSFANQIKDALNASIIEVDHSKKELKHFQTNNKIEL